MSCLGQYAKTFVKQVETDNWFFVSTINRESSSMYGGEYSETMAWKWDNIKQERGKLILQRDSFTDDMVVHTAACEVLQSFGKELQDE